MALKAGRVGVDPSQIDAGGMIIGGGGDSYTKAEIDTMLASKADVDSVYPKQAIDTLLASKADVDSVYPKQAIDALLGAKADKSTLTANEKEFNFAYDSTTQKYGYKAGSDGQFNPFLEAGDFYGWVTPANLSEDWTLEQSYLSNKSGGYVVHDGLVYIDVFITRSSGTSSIASGTKLAHFPVTTTGTVGVMYWLDSGAITNPSISLSRNTNGGCDLITSASYSWGEGNRRHFMACSKLYDS